MSVLSPLIPDHREDSAPVAASLAQLVDRPLGVVGVLGLVVHHELVVDKVETVGARLIGAPDHLRH